MRDRIDLPRPPSRPATSRPGVPDWTARRRGTAYSRASARQPRQAPRTLTEMHHPLNILRFLHVQANRSRAPRIGCSRAGRRVFTNSQPDSTADRRCRRPDSLFRITVVGRTTPAINYRPRRGDTKLDFKGTALMPQAVGEAKVSGEQGYMNVEAKFDRFASASSFGSPTCWLRLLVRRVKFPGGQRQRRTSWGVRKETPNSPAQE